MKRFLLIFISFFILTLSVNAQTNIAVSNFFAGSDGCGLSASRVVSVGVENVGTTDLSGVPFNLSYTINGGVPVTDFNITVPSLPPGQLYTHIFTVPANLSAPGTYNFVSYSSGLVGDNVQTNDTTYESVINTSSVGGIVTSDDTVCAGTNSGTLNLTGNIGTVVRWERSNDMVSWINIGNPNDSSITYNNLNDTAYFRVIVKNGSCPNDSSFFATISVTPIPMLSSSLNIGVCSGSTLNYFPTSTIPGATFTWSRDSVAHITPVDSSGIGNISEVLYSDTSVHVYTSYTIITSANGCTNSGETVFVTVDSIPPGPAGVISGIDSVCQNTTRCLWSIAPISPDTVGWYTWNYNGLGVSRTSSGPPTPFTSSTSTCLFFSATATSGDLFVMGTNYCGSGPSSPFFPIAVDTAAIAIAGSMDSVCQSAAPQPILLSGSSVGGPMGIGGTWSIISGGGALNNTTSTTMPDTVTYTPAPGFVGVVTLRLTTDDPPGVCGGVNSDRIIRVDTAAFAIAGGPNSACQSANPDTILLTGAMVGGPVTTEGSWSVFTGSGTLSYTGPTNQPDTVTFVPAPNFAGLITLRLTTNDPGLPCGPVFTNRTINVDSFALVTAGPDDTICAGSNIMLAGNISGGASSSTWTTTGDGTFNDSSLVNAIYTPGVNDTANGTVTLIITTDDPAGPCSFVVDSMILTIEPEPLVNAGLDDTICAGGNYTLAGSFGGTATFVTWTTSGDGVFSDSSLVNAIYTPGVNDTAAGNVYLILTTNDPIGTCTAVFDSMLLTINPPAYVSAGTDTAVCAAGNITLAGQISGGATASTWTTSGDGVFNDSSLVNAVYTPGANDIVNGTVTLYITSNDPAGPCLAVVDSMLLTIDSVAIVNAGVDDVVCSGNPYTLSGTMSGSATAIAWTTMGDGTFNDTTLVNAVYTPGANDITNGSVILIITSNDPVGACSAVVDSMLLTISVPPVLVITDPMGVCQPFTVNLTDSAVTAGSTPGLTFTYYTDSLATTHVTDSTAITASGTYYIVGRTPLGCADTAAVNVVVNLAAVGGIASVDALVCPGNNSDTIQLTNYVGAIQQWQYSTDAGVTWTNIPNTTDMQPYSNLTITTWYRAMLSATCASAVSEEARITVDPHPLSIGGTTAPNDTVCSGNNNGIIYLTGQLGVVLRWEYSIDGGNTWVYVNNTTDSLVYSNLTETTLFHAVVQNSVCGHAVSANDTITITTSSDAGTIMGNAPGCPNTTSGILVLAGNSGNATLWQYSADGITWTDTLNLSDSLAYNNLSDTTYYRAVVQADGCTADTSGAIAVIVYPKPDAQFTADTVCLGAATTFTNTSTVASGYIQFNQWDFGDNATSLLPNPVHTYPALGNYTANLVVMSNFGCNDTATVTVLTDTLPDAQITANGPLTFCCGDSVTLSGAAGYIYLWSSAGATTQSINISDCNASGTYQLTVTEAGSSCSNTSSVTVNILPLPTPDIGNDTAINLGTQVLLDAQTTGGIIYTWDPITNLSNPGIANPVATPVVNTTYIVSVTDLNGCVNADTITISIIPDVNNIVVTNLLTVNADGYNDYWTISDLEQYPNTEVIVVNREGQQVYYSSFYANNWNGTNKNGKPLPDGTYYYFIKFANSNKVFKGPITILNEK